MRKNHFSFILRKRAAAILLLLAISISAGAQTPMFFKYQAIVRDSVGSPMASSNVGMRISILEASITGTPVYSEVHNVLTSPGGLITLNIGGGIPEQGNFINIDWGVAEYFVKVEVKPENSVEFIFMGTSQLMSVPYALYAKHAYGPPIYSWQDIQNLPDPGPGMLVYVSDMQTLAYYNDSTWVVLGDCPPVTPADAGADQLNIDGTSAVLQANIPQTGTGMWSVISGTGGAFSDPTDPSTTFTGEHGQIYELAWTITNQCNQTSSDNVFIGFCALIGIVSAGGDAVDACSPYALQGSDPGTGNTAQWQILAGSGGSLSDAGNPNAELTGVSGVTYILTYTVSNACGGESDTVSINFAAAPTQADAGEDQQNINGTFTELQANIPQTGTGMWSIISGTGGAFSDPTDPSATFTGEPGQIYELAWTITNLCNQTSSDNVIIGFCSLIGTVSAGEDVNDACSPYTLQGSNPGSGNNALWEIVSGIGGSLSNPTDPNAEFTGNHGETYTLSYTVSNACDTVSDMLTIAFSPYPTMPDAGPDMIGLTELTVTLQGNQAVTGTGVWTIISGVGGVLSNPGDPNSLFTGQLNQAYTLKWTISNACYSNFDNVNIAFAAAFVCGLDFTDPRDNQVYPTVQIGDQCWMAKNLNVGNWIAFAPSDNGVIEKSCFGHDPVNCDDFGGLYKWDEMMDYQTTEGSQGICPDGWYIPTVNDFNALINLLGGDAIAGGKMKEQGDLYWLNNVGATNETGFSARGGGYAQNGTFAKFKEWGRLFSSSQQMAGYPYFMGMTDASTYGWTNTVTTAFSYSVRCIKSD